MMIRNDGAIKRFQSPDYNYVFCRESGYFARWGKTFADDPQWSPFGPEILDIEVTTSCSGNCPFCYKANTPNGNNMTIDTFRKILDKMPDTLTQVAFGADAHCTSNRDIWAMMDYCRKKNIVPNITVADISAVTAEALSRYCGAVAVSRYDNKNACYDSVYKLASWKGMKQVNIHQLIAEETFDNAMETVEDIGNDPRLDRLNALVFLALKKKGRGESYHPLPKEKLRTLVEAAVEKKIRIGFDSCSAHKAIEVMPSVNPVTVEPCESACFSAYINVDGKFLPCSFCEGASWHEGLAGRYGHLGISVLDTGDFIKEVWMNPWTKQFRANLIRNSRQCPIYEV